MKIIDIKNYECVGLNTFPSKRHANHIFLNKHYILIRGWVTAPYFFLNISQMALLSGIGL